MTGHAPPLQKASEQWGEKVHDLLQRIVQHFENTDSPIGSDAAHLLREGDFLSALLSGRIVMPSSDVPAATEEAS